MARQRIIKTRPLGKMRIYRYDEQGTLMKECRRLIVEDSRTTRMIAQASGIPPYWLKKFRRAEMTNPSVNRVQYLYEFLTQKDLIPKE